ILLRRMIAANARVWLYSCRTGSGRERKGASLMNDTTFDYIIVGAGAAGSVLANRLSENPKNSVLLLEFGGSDGYFMHRIPKGLYFTMSSVRVAYRKPTKPFRENGEGEVWACGKATGGSKTFKGMMYMRGFARDWDPIAEGKSGWGWRDIVPIYRVMV